MQKSFTGHYGLSQFEWDLLFVFQLKADNVFFIINILGQLTFKETFADYMFTAVSIIMCHFKEQALHQSS